MILWKNVTILITRELGQSELLVPDELLTKIGAMAQILDKFGLYITRLRNFATDTSYRAKECNRIKGYLDNWKNSKCWLTYVFILSS